MYFVPSNYINQYHLPRLTRFCNFGFTLDNCHDDPGVEPRLNASYYQKAYVPEPLLALLRCRLDIYIYFRLLDGDSVA